MIEWITAVEWIAVIALNFAVYKLWIRPSLKIRHLQKKCDHLIDIIEKDCKNSAELIKLYRQDGGLSKARRYFDDLSVDNSAMACPDKWQTFHDIYEQTVLRVHNKYHCAHPVSNISSGIINSIDGSSPGEL